jgi:hypothetical protein
MDDREMTSRNQHPEGFRHQCHRFLVVKYIEEKGETDGVVGKARPLPYKISHLLPYVADPFPVASFFH